jgi:hypothetical protein
MHELLTILRNCAIYQEFVGRRDLRPGTLVNVDETTAERLVKSGYARRLVEPAPLFVDATKPPERPKKARKRGSDGGSSDVAR